MIESGHYELPTECSAEPALVHGEADGKPGLMGPESLAR